MKYVTKEIWGKAKAFLCSRGFIKPFIGVIVGAGLGFLYYHFIGCSSGNCAITGTPLGSIVFGGLLGLFITSSPCLNGKC
jgi:hypothetical protein